MTKKRFKGCGFESHQSRFYFNFFFPVFFTWLFLKGSHSSSPLPYLTQCFPPDLNFNLSFRSALFFYLPVCPGAWALESKTEGRETEGEGKWAWTPR